MLKFDIAGVYFILELKKDFGLLKLNENLELLRLFFKTDFLGEVNLNLIWSFSNKFKFFKPTFGILSSDTDKFKTFLFEYILI